jgi:hypothetical protein
LPDARVLRRDLLAWWTLHGRHGIPWKLRSDGSAPRDGEPLCPFRIWVAEVMLQQTQLAVMRPYWERWMLAFPDVVEKASWGERAFFVNPGGVLASGAYFATCKLKDGPNDAASRLDARGAWRFNIGLPPALFEARFGPRPARPPKGGVVGGDWDFTAEDRPTPHPVYGWMGWIAIVNPRAATLDGLEVEIEAAYQKARAAAGRRIARK